MSPHTTVEPRETRLPRYRPDLENIPTYDPGRPTAEIGADLGLDRLIELAANECPTSPFPEIQAAVAAAVSNANRYPLSDATYLVEALAGLYHLESDQIWVGPGSTSILTSIALAAGGPGTSIVFGNPSFVVYRMASALTGAEPVAVPLDSDWRLDPDAMAAAVRPDTNLIYYCNPNNPTGTHSSHDAVRRLVETVPERVTIVIDEAYAEYAVAPDYASAMPLITDHDNVVVSRTFSKVYGLAGLRVGYAVGDPRTIRALRRPQAPYATGSLAQAAAIEALAHQDLVARRVASNGAGRRYLAERLRLLGQTVIDSQTNFILWRPTSEPAALAESMLSAGVMVRPMGPWIRVTVGTEDDNTRAIEAAASSM